MPYGFHVVLVEPEIPQNTGSIGRVCLATQSTLHLVEPLGFELSHSRLRRAGLDYWQYLSLQVHPCFSSFLDQITGPKRGVFFSKKASRSLFDFNFLSGDYLVFGKETAGLPEEFLATVSDSCVRIPLYDDRVRSLNLANAVSIGLYQAIAQLNRRAGNPGRR